MFGIKFRIIDLSVPFSVICRKCWRIVEHAEPKYCIDTEGYDEIKSNSCKGRYFCQECTISEQDKRK